MSRTVQVAIDASDPHALCQFWAEVMDYEVEDHHDQILHLVEAGWVTLDETVERDGRRVFPDAAACRPRDGDSGPRLLFQKVPETKTVKNRVHLDVRVGEEGRDAEVARLVGLGARRLWDGHQGPHTWVTLADPEGNEFCLT
jgi:hypothetical protein